MAAKKVQMLWSMANARLDHATAVRARSRLLDEGLVKGTTFDGVVVVMNVPNLSKCLQVSQTESSAHFEAIEQTAHCLAV